MFDFLKIDRHRFNYPTREHNTAAHAQRIIVAENKRLINVNHEEGIINRDVHTEKHMSTTQIALRLYK